MLPEAEDYFLTMAGRNRLLSVDDGWTALCTFFVLQDETEIPTFYDRRCWTTPPDHATGSIIYFDKLISKTFNRDLWRGIEEQITHRFPSWEQFVWYRPRPGQQSDRKYLYERRRSLDGADVHG